MQQINNKRSILFILHAERLRIYYKANQNQENSSIGDKENNQQKESWITNKDNSNNFDEENKIKCKLHITKKN